MSILSNNYIDDNKDCKQVNLLQHRKQTNQSHNNQFMKGQKVSYPRKTLSTVKDKVASFLLLTSNYDLHILLSDKQRCPLKSFKHEITGIH